MGVRALFASKATRKNSRKLKLCPCSGTILTLLASSDCFLWLIPLNIWRDPRRPPTTTLMVRLSLRVLLYSEESTSATAAAHLCLQCGNLLTILSPISMLSPSTQNFQITSSPSGPHAIKYCSWFFSSVFEVGKMNMLKTFASNALISTATLVSKR